jgi:hypothetical protein
MGVCTQFDVLWQQLKGQEHLLIYGLVKGLSFDQVGMLGNTFDLRIHIDARRTNIAGWSDTCGTAAHHVLCQTC